MRYVVAVINTEETCQIKKSASEKPRLATRKFI